MTLPHACHLQSLDVLNRQGKILKNDKIINMTMNEFDAAIKTRKSKLISYLQSPMQVLSEKISAAWNDRDAIDGILYQTMQNDAVLNCSNQMYILDTQGVQVSSLVAKKEQQPQAVGTDLSDRPYFKESRPDKGLTISRSYKNRADGHTCVTAMQTIYHGDELLGYLAADCALLELPVSDDQTTRDRRIWLQVKGDPSIRGTLFMQSRAQSLMDENLDDVISIMEELILSRGVFHAKLHFSSSRSTLWLYDDPYHYRVHVLDEILNAVLLAYPPRKYPDAAVVPKDLVLPVFQQFKELRNIDDTVYLRAGSLNTINGMVALNFSCDGSHYIPVEKFLDQGVEFWMGSAGSTAS
jgi:hypothetical protein